MKQKLISLSAFVTLFVCAVEAGEYFTNENGKKYYIENTKELTWYEAIALCNDRGMTLITPDTDEAKTEISNVLQKFMFDKFIWTSGQKVAESDFVFITNGRKRTFTLEQPGVADSLGPGPDCLAISQSHGLIWAYTICSLTLRVVCEESTEKRAMNQAINFLKIENNYLKSYKQQCENHIEEIDKELKKMLAI